MAAQPDDFAAFLRLLDAHPEWIEALQERIVDEKAILRVLDKNAEVRDAVRRRILQEEFLQLPALIRQLIEAQQRSEAQLQEHNRILQRHGELIQQLIEAQQRSEAQLQEHNRILQRHGELIQQLIEAQQRSEAQLQEHNRILQRHGELIQQLIEAQQRSEAQLQEHNRILQRHGELIQQLIEAQQRSEAQLQEHNRILQRHGELIQQLIEAQQRSEAQLQEHNRILQRHGELIQQLIEAQQHTEAQVQEVVTVLQQILLQVQDLSEARQRFDDWIRGEEGRRRGEQLERMTVRRATTIFGGGRGGSPEQAHVQQQLLRWLRRVRDAGLAYNPDADPTLSDLLWWKGDRVLVGEVSVKVDASDILRARQRADTLRRAQVDAIPIVIGEDWANEELREIAQQQGVEWFVPPEVSQGVVAFRKIEEGEEENGRGRRRRVR